MSVSDKNGAFMAGLITMRTSPGPGQASVKLSESLELPSKPYAHVTDSQNSTH